jgi:hypothetical protein
MIRSGSLSNGLMTCPASCSTVRVKAAALGRLLLAFAFEREGLAALGRPGGGFLAGPGFPGVGRGGAGLAGAGLVDSGLPGEKKASGSGSGAAEGAALDRPVLDSPTGGVLPPRRGSTAGGGVPAMLGGCAPRLSIAVRGSSKLLGSL